MHFNSLVAQIVQYIELSEPNSPLSNWSDFCKLTLTKRCIVTDVLLEVVPATTHFPESSSYIQRVNADGELMWGTDGIRLDE